MRIASKRIKVSEKLGYNMQIPVVLITFNRPEHTRRTLEALLVQSPEILYVFQDGARKGNVSDQENCPKVRWVIEDCLKGKEVQVHTHFSEVNRGCREAVIFAISEVLKDYEAVIVVEDDIVTSPAFLSYMNKALEYYRDRKSVFSISGHSHSPEHFRIPEDYPYDVYASPRLFNWGWGTWRDRWEQADWSFSYYDAFMSHPLEMQAFMRGGDDLLPMLKEEHDGNSSAWDIQFAFAHFKNHAVSIVPCRSYTVNIGEDGSGTHCHDLKKGAATKTGALSKKKDPVLLDNLYFDTRILNLQYSYFSSSRRPLWQKAINYLARKVGRKPPFIIKKKIFV